MQESVYIETDDIKTPPNPQPPLHHHIKKQQQKNNKNQQHNQQHNQQQQQTNTGQIFTDKSILKTNSPNYYCRPFARSYQTN